MRRRTTSSDECRRPQGGGNTLADIVRRYITECRSRCNIELAHFERQPSLAAAVGWAALCKRTDGKRHSHQRRIPGESLAEASRRLRTAPLAACRSFDDLHQAVKEHIDDIPMIGELTIYDIAHRIGMFLRLEPTRVYLHCGTRTGARALGFRNRETLEVSELPAPFRKLAASEIEDCLCIYKDDLARLARQRT